MANTTAPSFDEIIGILDENAIQVDDEQINQIKTVLTQCNEDKNVFITKLIDSYFRPNTISPPTTRFSKDIAGIILYQCFKNTDLNTANIIEMASNIIPNLKKGDVIDMEAVSDILHKHQVSGNVFAKGTTEYMNGAKFSRLFKPVSNWKETKGVYSKFWKQINRWDHMQNASNSKTKRDCHMTGDERMLAEVLRSDQSAESNPQSLEMTERKTSSFRNTDEMECNVAFTECGACQRVKSTLIKYQNMISRSAHDDELETNSQNVTGDLFGDDKYSAIDLLDDFHHILGEHHINDHPAYFDSCFEFIVHSKPEISCDIKQCKAVRLHFSRRRGRVDIDGGNNKNIEIPTDYRTAILWQIHSFLVHSLETTMLTKRERMDIEKELKVNGDDEDGDQDPDDLELRLMAERMQQKSTLTKQIVDNSDNTKFVTTADFVENEVKHEDEEKVEVITSLDEDDVKYPEQRPRSTIQQDDEQILDIFCSLTSCDKAVAVFFLKKSDWNLQKSINSFYKFGGDPTQIESICEQKESVEADGVYTEGVRFWYWKRDHLMPESAVPVNRHYETLKEEVTSTGLVGMITWTRFVVQCQALIHAKRVRKMSANGIDEDIYAIRAGVPFALKFLVALKLYTDFDAVNTMFCEHFRLKKLTPILFESLNSLAIRNGKFWSFAKTLVECVQCFGRLLVRKKTKYYRGVGNQFILKRFVARFHVPLSTSKSVCQELLHSLCTMPNDMS